MNQVDSSTIRSIRFPLAVMVVAIHAYISITGWTYNEVAQQGTGSNVAQFFMIAISHVLTHVAVPTFFLISGYLFFTNFGNGDRETWSLKMKNRIQTLVLPFVLWITLYILWSLILDYRILAEEGLLSWIEEKGGLKMYWNSETWNLTRVDVWGHKSIASAPKLIPFWFMRDLLVCVAISPIFYFVFRKETCQYVKIAALATITFPLHMAIGYLSVPIMAVSICLCIYYILNKYTPSLCRFLSGGR